MLKSQSPEDWASQLTTDEIVFYLRVKYHPHAILLHGSRTRGDGFDKSDYDLAVITENPDQVNPEYYQGQVLDISGISPTEPILKAEKTPTWLCSILFDDADGLGERLVKKTPYSFPSSKSAINPSFTIESVKT